MCCWPCTSVVRFPAPLHHKDDPPRDFAILAAAELVRHSTDADAVTKFISDLFDVYFGADGKLTVTTHKVTVLQAIEACSVHGVQKCTALIDAVLTRWVKVVDVESHEGSLLQAMAVLKAWLSLVRGPTPQIITSNMDRHLNMKTWSTAVRSAYFCSLRAGLSKSCTMAPGLLKPVLKALEKALGQQQQLPSIVEALSASSYLLSLSAADGSLESHLNSLWTSSLDFNRCFFTSDKFLSSAPYDGLVELVNVVEVLLVYHYNRIADHEPLLLRCLAACLCWQPSDAAESSNGDTKIGAEVRAAARAALKRLLSSLVGGRIATAAMKAFAGYLDTIVNMEVTARLLLPITDLYTKLLFY